MAFARYDQLTDPDTGGTQDVWALYFGGKAEQIYWNGDSLLRRNRFENDYVWRWWPVRGKRHAIGRHSAHVQSDANIGERNRHIFDPDQFGEAQSRAVYYYYLPGTFSIQAITNNFGYQMRFGLAGPVTHGGWQTPSSVVLFNMAVICAPTAASCTFTRTWPRLTFEYSAGKVSAITETGGARTAYYYGAASQRIETIDGPGNRDTSITYQNCGPLPPFGQCNAGNQNIGGYRVQTVSKGGRTWTYSWDTSLVGPNPEHGVRVTSAACAMSVTVRQSRRTPGSSKCTFLWTGSSLLEMSCLEPRVSNSAGN